MSRGRARWLWQPDKWDRLTTVARLLGSTGVVADVGGRGHELRGLVAARAAVSVNVELPCDVLVAPGPLPFVDDAFDAVTSCDVLEHLPAEERSSHLEELLRIARTRVVLCFPAGSEAKDASERRLADRLAAEYDVQFDFLDEHLEHGLPRVADVLSTVGRAAPHASVRVNYQDGVLEGEKLLMDAVHAVKGRHPSSVLRSARAWLVRRRPVLVSESSPDNNRAYVVIDLAPPAPR